MSQRDEEIGNNFISEPIKFLLQGSCKTQPDKLHLFDKFFSTDSTYEWSEIEKLGALNFHEEFELTHKFCEEWTIKLRPIWEASENHFNRVLLQNSNLLTFYLKWTGQEEIILHFLNGPKSETKTLENVLLLTAVMENSLGNIYFTVTRKAPPHLLRDLLKTEELKRIFGSLPIFFLRILLGTPNSVNLRNIAWHGFPSVGDIPSYFVAVLVTSITSLSKILNRSVFNIVRRKYASNFRSYIDQMNCNIDENAIAKEINDMDNLTKTSSVPKSHIVIWKRIYELYILEDYPRLILLLLTQLEFILRIMYGDLNAVDVSAKLDKYYIILDTILEETVGNDPVRRNEIYHHLNESSLKLMYDMFISLSGPRIRDKISHGEVDLMSIDRKTCSVLLYLLFSILFENFQLDNYESCYHLNSKFHKNIKAAKTNLEKLKALKIPESLKDKMDWNKSHQIVDYNISLNKGRIQIFFRPVKENEVVLQMIKIAKFLNIACKNLIENFDEKFELFKQKLLRSRCRATLAKMLEILPKTCDFLQNVAKILEVIFYKLQTCGEMFLEENSVQLLKFLKHILKFVENLSKYCNKTSNQWERSEKVCSSFNEVFQKYKNIL